MYMMKNKKRFNVDQINELEELSKSDYRLKDLLEKSKQRKFLSHHGSVAKYDTLHGHERKQDRDIKDMHVAIAQYYGRPEKRGPTKGRYCSTIKYELHRNDLKNTLFSKYSLRLDGLVVIMRDTKPEIFITAYWSNGLKASNKRTRWEDNGFKKKQTRKYKRIKQEMSASWDNF